MEHPRKFAGLGAALAFAAVLMAGCAGPQPAAAPAPASSGPSGQTQTQPKVSRVVVALKVPPNEASNPRLIAGFDPFQLRPSFESLLDLDASTGKFIPDLATGWKVEENSTAIRLTLRKGVPFHFNYGEFTAKDVQYTYDSLVSKDDSHRQVGTWRAIVKQLEVVNDYEVVLRINPNINFMRMISNGQAELAIRSKAAADKEGDPVDLRKGLPGTGPYQFKERVQGAYFRMDRVPYQHWRSQPDFPEFEFRWINEPSTRLAALLANEVHVTDIPQELQPSAEKSGMQVIAGRVKGPRVVGQFYCCWLDPQTGKLPMYPESPLASIKVRQALNKAIDRDELAKAFVPKSQPLYIDHFDASWPAWTESWKGRFNDMYGFDLNKARALLAEAGYTATNPMKLNVLAQRLTYIPNGPDVAEAMATQWRKAGIDVTLMSLDDAQEAQLSRAYKFDNHIRLQSYSFDSGRAIQVFNTPTTPPGGGYFDQEILAAWKKLSVELAPEKQEPLLKEIGERGYTQFWDIPLWWVPLELTVNPTIVAGYQFPGVLNGGWSHFENIKAVR